MNCKKLKHNAQVRTKFDIIFHYSPNYFIFFENCGLQPSVKRLVFQSQMCCSYQLMSLNLSFISNILILSYNILEQYELQLFLYFWSYINKSYILIKQLDVLVNNAGRSQRAEWMNIDIRVDKDLFDGNVFGLLNLSRVVMPHFLAKKQGQIAVTSSVCGKVGAPCSASYNATKHALHVRSDHLFFISLYVLFMSNLYRVISKRCEPN